MLNSIYETSVRPDNENGQKVVFNIIRIVKYVVLILSAVILSLAFFIDNGFWFVLILSLGLFAFLSYMQSKFYNFYDYCVYSDQITISIVINNLKSKQLISFNVKNILELGKIEGDNYYKHQNDKSIKKIDALNGVVYNVDYYALVEIDNKKYLVLLRYDKKMLSILLKYNVSRVILKDFKETIKSYE